MSIDQTLAGMFTDALQGADEGAVKDAFNQALAGLGESSDTGATGSAKSKKKRVRRRARKTKTQVTQERACGICSDPLPEGAHHFTRYHKACKQASDAIKQENAEVREADPVEARVVKLTQEGAIPGVRLNKKGEPVRCVVCKEMVPEQGKYLVYCSGNCKQIRRAQKTGKPLPDRVLEHKQKRDSKRTRRGIEQAHARVDNPNGELVEADGTAGTFAQADKLLTDNPQARAVLRALAAALNNGAE